MNIFSSAVRGCKRMAKSCKRVAKKAARSTVRYGKAAARGTVRYSKKAGRAALRHGPAVLAGGLLAAAVVNADTITTKLASARIWR